MPEYLADVKITKVYKGKSGEHHEYGPWTAWNFYVANDKRKFSYFSGGKKPIPSEGRTVKLIEFEIERSGEYTNYTVKKLVYGQDVSESQDPGPPPYDEMQGPPAAPIDAYEETPPEHISEKPDPDISFYISYSKDLCVAMMQSGMPIGDTPEDVIDKVVVLGKRMYALVQTGVPF